MTSIEITAVITAGGVVAVNLLTLYFNNRNQRKTDEKIVVMDQKVGAVDKKVDVVHNLVNAPLGKALDDAATSAEALARLSLREEDITEAGIARRRSDDHKAAQAVADAETVKQQKAINAKP